MTQDDYEVVVQNPTSLAETRAHNGFTETPGQCYYCSRVCKNLNGLRNHQKKCRHRARSSGVQVPRSVPIQPKRRPQTPTRRAVVDGGMISDDDVDIKPPLPGQQATPAANSTAHDLRAVNIELQRLRIDFNLMSRKLSVAEAKRSEITDKYIQLLEQRQNT